MVTSFSVLPVEIREAIYEFTLEDTPEVWIHDTSTPPPLPPYVLVGFPAIMHICYESRAVALKHISLADVPLQNGAKLLIPCRLFRPELDYVYAAQPLLILGATILQDPLSMLFTRARHLSFPADALTGNWKTLHRHLRKFPALADVSVVFGPHYGQLHSRYGLDDIVDEGGERAGRFRLRRCPEAGLRLRIDSETSAPANRTIAGMRKDLEVISRLVYHEEAASPLEIAKKPPAIKTVTMERLGKLLVTDVIPSWVQSVSPASRS